LVGPAVAARGEPDLIVSEWLAVSRGRVLLVWGAVADVTVENNEGGAFLGLAEDVEGVLDALNIVGVGDAQDVPPVGQKPRLDVLCKGDARFALDGDVVVVVDPAKVVETQVTGQRRCLGSNSLHHAAVSTHRINIVIENIEARPVVTVGEPLLGNAHSEARGNSFAEGTGGG